MERKIHHLGVGWEPHVDEINGRLIYSIPVETSFVASSFEFEITSADLGVLKSNQYRYAVLFFSLHSLLQNTFGPSFAGKQVPDQFSQNEFDLTVKKVLHSTDDELEAFIVRFDADNNISLKDYVTDFISQGSKT
jgi:hypothetical protein